MIPRSRRRRRVKELIFVGLFLVSIAVALATVVILLGSVVATALPSLRPSVLFNFASFSNPDQAGYAAAIVGTLWIVGLTLLFSLPLGIAAGVYLEEYAPRNRLTRLLEASVSNLAGVPSVVFGLIGLAVFVRAFGLGFTVIAASLTLTILVFPYVVITAQEAVRAVPQSIRDGAVALGSTKWQAIRRQVLPAGTPGLLTASILAASRTMGEAAPLIVISSFSLLRFLPDGPKSPFSVLPVQIFAYISQPPAFHGVAAAGVLILLFLLITFNSVAIVVRNRLQRRRW
ncbi:MAG TPA: phosphate ABC transporter permease PstA [Thermoplasmata archaeon]|nr:phosphate ABC transporter permease PstA [Thermoplasmata archaeon]